VVAELEGLRAQVERVVKSETFRTSEALQRLLVYLGEKRASGEADQLKEYTVGVDGLGRPASYNPGHDAAVRMQVGRLRQKLTEYYSAEGKDDPFVLRLPKGRFRLECDARVQAMEPLTWSAAPLVSEPIRPVSEGLKPHGKHIVVVLYSVIFILGLWAVVATTQLILDHRKLSRVADDLTPSLRELWAPFLASDRPLLIGIGDPVFVEFKGLGFYRVPAQNDWHEAREAARIAAIQKSLGAPEIRVLHKYANLGEVNSAFLLGKFLAPYFRHISLVRSSELSWQQLAGNNLLFIGGAMEIGERLKSMPTQLELMYEDNGIRLRNPRAGESSFLANPSPPGAFEEGETFALISHTPGPDGLGDVETFTSNSAPAGVGAVQWYSSSEHADYLVGRLKGRSSHIPRYYQIVLRVKYKGGVPTETSYVLHRELRLAPSSFK
jgi:hypothetical protein